MHFENVCTSLEPTFPVLETFSLNYKNRGDKEQGGDIYWPIRSLL